MLDNSSWRLILRTQQRNATRVGLVGLLLFAASLLGYAELSGWLSTSESPEITQPQALETHAPHEAQAHTPYETEAEIDLELLVVTVAGMTVGIGLILGGLFLYSRSWGIATAEDDGMDDDDKAIAALARMLPDDVPEETVDAEELRIGLRRAGLRRGKS